MATALGLFPTSAPFGPLTNPVTNAVNSLGVTPAHTGGSSAGSVQPVIDPWLQSLVDNSPKFPANPTPPRQLTGTGNFNFNEFEQLFNSLFNKAGAPSGAAASVPKKAVTAKKPSPKPQQPEPSVGAAEKTLNEVFTKGLNSAQTATRKKNGAAWQDFVKSLSPEQKAAQQKWHLLKAKGVPESEWKAAHKQYKDSLKPEQQALHKKSMDEQRKLRGSLSAPQKQMQDSIYDLRMLGRIERQAKK